MQGKKAISNIEKSPLYQSQVQAGEEALLQNASATGGLRGGNVQRALGEFRPQLLNQLIQQRYQNYGGLAGQGLNTAGRLLETGQQATTNIAQFGQAAAAGQAAGSLSTGSNLSNIVERQGQAAAGAEIAKGQAQADGIGGIAGAFGGIVGGSGGGALGGLL